MSTEYLREMATDYCDGPDGTPHARAWDRVVRECDRIDGVIASLRAKLAAALNKEARTHERYCVEMEAHERTRERLAAAEKERDSLHPARAADHPELIALYDRLAAAEKRAEEAERDRKRTQENYDLLLTRDTANLGRLIEEQKTTRALRTLLQGVEVDGFRHDDGWWWWLLRVPASEHAIRPDDSIASMQGKFDAALSGKEE